MELGVTDSDVLQVELRFCVQEPSFTAFWPDDRKLYQNDIEMTSRDGKLQHQWSNLDLQELRFLKLKTVELTTNNCGSLWKQQEGSQRVVKEKYKLKITDFKINLCNSVGCLIFLGMKRKWLFKVTSLAIM